MNQIYASDTFDPALEPPRTSVLAIVALVLSLICFIPGFGALGVLLGVIAIVMIAGSQGRLSGNGLAVSAIVLGLIISVVWIGVGIGVNQAIVAVKTQLVAPVNQALVALGQGDVKAIRGLLSPNANARFSDDQIEAFRAASQAEFGAFRSIPDGIFAGIQSYAKFGQQMQKYQAQPGQASDKIPIPAEFEKTPVLVVLQVDPPTGSPSSSGPAPLIPLKDITIEALGGKAISLSDFATPAPGAPPAAAPTAPPAPNSAPATGDQPEPPEPETPDTEAPEPQDAQPR